MRPTRPMQCGLTALVLLSAGCASQPAGPAQRGPATLTIHLTDAPGEITAAVVTIAQVYLQGTDGRTTVWDSDTTVNLVDLTETSTILLEDVEVAAGNYSQLRFVVTGAYIAITEPGETTPVYYASSPNYAELPTGVDAGELRLPSFSTSGLKVTLPDGGLTIPDAGQVSLLVDFDVAQSFGHQAGASGAWVMHPVIRATKLAEGTTLTVTLGTDVTLPDGVTLDQFQATLATQDDPGSILATVAFTDEGGTFTAPFGLVTPGDYVINLVVPAGIASLTTDPEVPYNYTVPAGAGTTIALTVTEATAP